MKNVMRYALLILFLVAVVLPTGANAAIEYCEVGVKTGVKVPCALKAFGGTGPAGQETAGTLISTILNIALALVGSIAVVFLIVGAYRYITAYGNEENAEAAKKMMTQAIIGIVIVILAFAIITVITNVLIGGRTTGTF